ncbi:MAG: hypothetical protein OEW75_04620 [Cyclobacteriaceae bacterium]|nr:hypothetical protein [Cyclobacteriaceae bacterium]
MKTLTENYINFTLIKGTVFLIIAYLIYMGISYVPRDLPYIVIVESLVFCIYLIVINRERRQLNILLVYISFFQLAIFITASYYLYTNNYIGHYISFIMSKFWTIGQSINIVVFLVVLMINNKKKWSMFAVLIVGVIAISLKTAINNAGSGDNAHIYWPIIGSGVYYIIIWMFLKRTIGKVDNE